MSGDLAELEQRLLYLFSEEGKADLFDRLGARLHELVQAGWDARADPMGDAWAATTRTNPILEDSGAMRGSTSYQVAGTTLTLTVDDYKAAFHQYGTSRGIVPRRMLPEDIVPPAWEEAMQEILTAWVTETMEV